MSLSVVDQIERELEDVQIKTASNLTDSFTPSLTTMKVKRGEENGEIAFEKMLVNDYRLDTQLCRASSSLSLDAAERKEKMLKK